VSNSEPAKEAVYLKSIFAELKILKNQCVLIHTDNQAAEALAKNQKFSHKLKHVDIRYHFIRDTINKNKVDLKYLRTDKNIADFLTKPVCKDKHYFCMKGLGLVPLV